MSRITFLCSLPVSSAISLLDVRALRSEHQGVCWTQPATDTSRCLMLIPLNTLRPHDPRCTVFNTCPRQLHHYTSIDTLALILSKKTIRFNRLDRVEDPLEAVSKEYTAAQMLVFASCWTFGEESIPHWSRYASLYGVCLTMPTLMFKGRHNNHKVTTDDRLYQLNISTDDAHALTMERRGKDFITLQASAIYGPTRIRYVNRDELASNNIYPAQPNAKYDLRMLGTKKHKAWEFEHEIRFRLLATSGYLSDLGGASASISPESFIHTPVVTQHVDVPIDDTAIAEAEVVLGPKTTGEQQAVVESLCAQYAPSASVRRSSIQIR